MNGNNYNVLAKKVCTDQTSPIKGSGCISYGILSKKSMKLSDNILAED